MRRNLSFILAAVLLCVFAAGCNSQKNQEDKNTGTTTAGYPIVTDKITLTAMCMQSGGMADDWNDMVYFKELERITNIHVDFQLVNQASYYEKKNLAFASNDLPDFFYKGMFSKQEEQSYSEQGTIIPLEAMIEKSCPNIMNTFLEYPELKRSMTLPNGHIVSLPNINAGVPRDLTSKYWINKNWLEALSLEVPQTVEELIEVFRAFKTKDPNQNGEADEIPFSFSDLSHVKYFMSAWGLQFASRNDFIDESGRVQFAPVTDAYREALTELKKMYAEKLIDQESFYQKGDKLTAKGQMPDQLLGSFVAMGPLSIVGDNRNSDYVLVPPLKTKDGKQVWSSSSGFSTGSFVITNVNKYPEETLRWADYAYSEEGGILLRAGIEGENYQKYDDSSWEYIIPEGKTKTEVAYSCGPLAGAPMPYRIPAQFIMSERESTPINSYINSEMEKLTPFLRQPMPDLYLPQSINKLNVDISAYVDRMIARFVTNDEDIDIGWDNYVATLRKMGVDDMLNILQESCDKYKEIQ